MAPTFVLPHDRQTIAELIGAVPASLGDCSAFFLTLQNGPPEILWSIEGAMPDELPGPGYRLEIDSYSEDGRFIEVRKFVKLCVLGHLKGVAVFSANATSAASRLVFCIGCPSSATLEAENSLVILPGKDNLESTRPVIKKCLKLRLTKHEQPPA
jgi:hypothetical protein